MKTNEVKEITASVLLMGMGIACLVTGHVTAALWLVLIAVGVLL